MQFIFTMNFSEIIIIYLALGSPFAVYFFLQNRNRFKTGQLWVKTILNFLFWIPFAFGLLWEYLKLKGSSAGNFNFFDESGSIKDELSQIQRKIESLISETDRKQSIFEIREILDRYIGLSLEVKSTSSFSEQTENDFFKIVDSPNRETASICNQRRNLKRLFFHHKLAANDFFNLVIELNATGKISQTLYLYLLELVLSVQDAEMQKKIKNLCKAEKQTSDNIFVSESERNLWITDQPKPLKNNQLSMSFQTVKAATNLSTKD